jgi:N utilization substance protein B
MGARTTGREVALQILFGIEVSGEDAERALSRHFREFGGDAESRPWTEACVRGVAGERDELDRVIGRASEHWRIERMTRVDRNVLRLGTWEILRRDDVPRAVVLDEAVELAKRFGSEESGAFVNGVLDRVAEMAGRVDRDR